jgi:hypothetical protein
VRCLGGQITWKETTGKTEDMGIALKRVSGNANSSGRAWVCGRSRAEISGSNPAGRVDVRLL